MRATRLVWLALAVVCTQRSAAAIKDHIAGVTLTPASTSPRDEAVSGDAMWKLIEEDWPNTPKR